MARGDAGVDDRAMRCSAASRACRGPSASASRSAHPARRPLATRPARRPAACATAPAAPDRMRRVLDGPRARTPCSTSCVTAPTSIGTVALRVCRWYRSMISTSRPRCARATRARARRRAPPRRGGGGGRRPRAPRCRSRRPCRPWRCRHRAPAEDGRGVAVGHARVVAVEAHGADSLTGAGSRIDDRCEGHSSCRPVRPRNPPTRCEDGPRDAAACAKPVYQPGRTVSKGRRRSVSERRRS